MWENIKREFDNSDESLNMNFIQWLSIHYTPVKKVRSFQEDVDDWWDDLGVIEKHEIRSNDADWSNYIANLAQSAGRSYDEDFTDECKRRAYLNHHKG